MIIINTHNTFSKGMKEKRTKLKTKYMTSKVVCGDLKSKNFTIPNLAKYT